MLSLDNRDCFLARFCVKKVEKARIVAGAAFLPLFNSDKDHYAVCRFEWQVRQAMLFFTGLCRVRSLMTVCSLAKS